MQCDSITVRISHLGTQTLLLHGTIPWSVFLNLKFNMSVFSPVHKLRYPKSKKTAVIKLTLKTDFVDAGSSQRNTIRVSTVKNNIIIPSSRAVDEDLFFSLNFLGMAVVATWTGERVKNLYSSFSFGRALFKLESWRRMRKLFWNRVIPFKLYQVVEKYI